MLHAFFVDADSFKDADLLCLAGFVSDDDGWTSFEKEWFIL